ncbi:MAG: c-type cytochrome [Proteobacteria bacterium]|nr:c-type cytochrome [Pseudomonadota bacterium]MCP4917966.1 c-type cytochrome [Pseudomonadota bacterium]
MAVQEHHVHITPLATYFKVFGGLLVLTILTVVVSRLGLEPTTSIIVAMAVASVKAFLVAAWFMHLKYDTKFNVLAFGSAIWFAGLFFIFTCFDLGSRDSILAIQGHDVARMDAALALMPEAGAADAGHEAPAPEAAAVVADEEAVADAGEAAPAASDFDAAGAYGMCAACHGAEGDGQGPAGAALTPPARDFTDAAWWDSVSDEKVASVIKDGGAANGLSPLMAGYGAQWNDDEIAALVEYLKTFKK